MRIVYVDLKRGATHLNVIIDVLLHDYRLPYLNQSAKLRFIILYEELARWVAIDSCMETRHRDIGYAYVGVMSPTDTDVIAVFHVDDVNDANILQGDTFEDDVVFFR